MSYDKKIIAALIKDTKSRLLIVGTKPSNIPESFRRMGRVEFWDNDKYSQNSANRVPHDIKWVLATRFVGHGWLNAIKANSHSDATIVYPVGTGRIRRILKIMMPQQTQQQTATPEQAISTSPMKDFLTKNLNVQNYQHDKPSEIARLLEVARQTGFHTSRHSLSGAIWRFLHPGYISPSRLKGKPRSAPKAQEQSQTKTEGVDKLTKAIDAIHKLRDLKTMLEMALAEVKAILEE